MGLQIHYIQKNKEKFNLHDMKINYCSQSYSVHFITLFLN